MQYINARSLTPHVRDWLANSCQPRILHVFDRACNLINERREVLSIVTQQIGNGPFNLVVEDDILFSDHLNTQSAISIRDNHLNIGDITIKTEDAKLWSPRPDWKMLYTKRDDVLSQLMSLRGDCFELDASRTALATTLPFTNYQFSNSLISALVLADLPSSLTAAQQLAGLGQGLTPAGDDYILGAVLAAWIIHPLEMARILAQEITDTAAPLTTSLSAAWLKSAGRGEAGILWHDFFNALISGNTVSAQIQITKLLSVGETSGADALAGFFGVCIYPQDNH